MYKAILLDLDNTLVLYNEPEFYSHYFAALAKTFADLIPPEDFQTHLLHAIYGLQKNTGSMPNSDFFMQIFTQGDMTQRETIWNRFDNFYHTTYPTLPVKASPAPNLQNTLQTLQERNLKLVLATNPLYPKTAVEKRLGWIDQSTLPFDHITHIENTTYVKPHPNYFIEICDAIEVLPKDCLMVGNDPAYDMAAQGAGIKTLLTTDAPPNHYTMPGAPPVQNAPTPDHQGSFSTLLTTLFQ